MFSEIRWKVILLVATTSVAAVEPSRALSLVYQQPYKSVYKFVPRNLYRRRGRQSRVLFLDDAENHQNYGRGEIDLTLDSHVKFDDSSDYEFTSPEEARAESTTKVQEDLPSGNERFYEPLPRFRQFQAPQYYQGRFGRPYAPSFGFDPYQTVAPFAPSLRNSFYSGYNGWKARSPRVVFPYATDSANSLVHTNSHGGPGLDNVVFRDQNFANEVGTDEQSLQDINGGSDAFTERDVTGPHRAQDKTTNNLTKPMFVQTDMKLARNDFFPNIKATVLPEFKPITDEQIEKITKILKEMSGKRTGRLLDSSAQEKEIKTKVLQKVSQKEDRQDEKKCPQGGTCEFFFYCWMVGGLLEGSCGGLLKGCCHRVAKAGILGVQDSNSIDYGSSDGFSYGPVINDESKCCLKTIWTFITPLRNVIDGWKSLIALLNCWRQS